jgi:hypothetical protein
MGQKQKHIICKNFLNYVLVVPVGSADCVGILVRLA